ncbi:MAG: hypothetical protein K2J89_07185 [Clostridia bacterium]|nr:hypothetical protein [Clostridia bacterium]
MKTAKKVIITIFIVICCGIWSYGIMFVNFFTQNIIGEIVFPTPTLHIYAERWDITFPKDAKIEYRYSTQGGFFGEGQNYAIIILKDHPDEFLQVFSKDNSDEYIETYKRIANRLIDGGLEESKILYPDENFILKKLDRFNDHDILIMAYDENTNKLYYIEELK